MKLGTVILIIVILALIIYLYKENKKTSKPLVDVVVAEEPRVGINHVATKTAKDAVSLAAATVLSKAGAGSPISVAGLANPVVNTTKSDIKATPVGVLILSGITLRGEGRTARKCWCAGPHGMVQCPCGGNSDKGK